VEPAYTPVVVYCIMAAVIVAAMTGAIGRLARRNPSAAKLQPYECGVVPSRGVGPRVHIRFYLVALLFVVFDVETASFYPWAVRLRHLGATGLGEMALFVVVLAIGYAYVWKKGGLEWQ
jgi:NADH-quinone oxidoreductase subunit A